jgi:hypothetical protein
LLTKDLELKYCWTFKNVLCVCVYVYLCISVHLCTYTYTHSCIHKHTY